MRFFAQNPSEVFVGSLIRVFRILALPTLKFRSSLVACRAPNGLPRDPFGLFAANLFDVGVNHSAAVRGPGLLGAGARPTRNCSDRFSRFSPFVGVSYF